MKSNGFLSDIVGVLGWCVCGGVHSVCSSLKMRILKQETKVTFKPFVYTQSLSAGYVTLGECPVIGLSEDRTTHSGLHLAATIPAAGRHFRVKGDMVRPQLAVLAVCT